MGHFKDVDLFDHFIKFMENFSVQMMEQMENIKEYFLTFLPAQKGFMNKNGVGNTVHYQRIKKALNNDLLLPTLSFLVYTSNIFKPFMLSF